MSEVDGEGKPLSKKALKKLEKREKKENEKKQKETERAAKEAVEVTEDYGAENYGKLKLNQSQERAGVQRTRVADINASRTGETVSIRARIYTSRSKSAKLAFFVFRQQVTTIQGVLAVDETNISKAFVKFAVNVPAESIVIVEGIVNKTAGEITSTTISDAELHIKKVTGG